MELLKKSIVGYGPKNAGQHILINYTISNNSDLSVKDITGTKNQISRAFFSYCDLTALKHTGDVVENDFLCGRIAALDGKLYIKLEIINPNRIYRENKPQEGCFVPVETPIEAIERQLESFEAFVAGQ